MAFIYEPIACHSYNIINVENMEVKVATIDTILAFYLSFMYANMPYYDKDRLLCIAMFLYHVEERNRLEQKGILKRFSIDCYGKQSTLEDMRSEKSEKYKELQKNKDKTEYEMWFLRYAPNDNKKDIQEDADEKIIKKRVTKRNKTQKKRNNIIDMIRKGI